jgi:predicted lactoylglutathione lyase
MATPEASTHETSGYRQMIFVNLPVADLPRSKAFFERLGYGFNPKFTNDQAACMVISETIYAMLLTRDFFRQFTPLPIADAKATTQVLTCLSAPSRDAVNALLDKALAAGGTEPRPAQDHGFMFGRSFADPDGHIWEIMWMDPVQAEKGCPQGAEVSAEATA